MCFSSILWLMVIDCLLVFLFGFDYLCFCREKAFSFVYFLSFHVFFHFSFPDISYFTCLHRVSAGPPIRKGTLLMLYYVYG